MKFFADVKSVLYEPDGFMSLPRLVFFLNFVIFGAAVLIPDIPADKASICMSALGVTGASFVGNKFVSRRKADE